MWGPLGLHISTFYIFDHLCYTWFQTAVVPHVSLDVHHADFGQLQDPNAVAQKVQFFSFSLRVALRTVGTYHLPKVNDKSSWKEMKHVFVVFPAENVREQRNICLSGKMFPLGTYHGKTGNSSCKWNVSHLPVWEASENLGCDFSCFYLSPVQLMWIYSSGSFHLPHRVKFYSFVFIRKISCG